MEPGRCDLIVSAPRPLLGVVHFFPVTTLVARRAGGGGGAGRTEGDRDDICDVGDYGINQYIILEMNLGLSGSKF